ncbi:MAG: hypothetical protein ACREK8_12120 [Gemmatimonadales bacterium]
MTRHAFAAIALVSVAAAPIAAQQTPDLAPFMIPDRAAEIALARTAAAPAISDSATVLVLTRTGFVEAAHGTNGFTCVVQRSWAGTIGDPDFWNPRVRGPSCLNPPATRTVLPEMLKRAEWIMAGVNTADIATRTTAAYASGEFPTPAPGAMIYMLSDDQYLQDGMPHHWKPHLMFYYDMAMPGATWGAGGFKSTIIDASAVDPHAHVRLLLIPVQQWSDGKPAM